jgi:hypothetical protein
MSLSLGRSISAESAQSAPSRKWRAQLAHLAVADHVDSTAWRSTISRQARTRSASSFASTAPFLFLEHQFDEFVGARQAAGMRGQDPLDASFHDSRSRIVQ